MAVMRLKVILRISKTFEKVWYDSIKFNLEQNSIFGNLRKILQDF